MQILLYTSLLWFRGVRNSWWWTPYVFTSYYTTGNHQTVWNMRVTCSGWKVLPGSGCCLLKLWLLALIVLTIGVLCDWSDDFWSVSLKKSLFLHNEETLINVTAPYQLAMSAVERSCRKFAWINCLLQTVDVWMQCYMKKTQNLIFSWPVGRLAIGQICSWSHWASRGHLEPVSCSDGKLTWRNVLFLYECPGS